MNRRKAIGSMVVGAAAAAPLARAQGSEVDTWVAWWERSKTYTLKVADAMPADSWNFKAHNETNTFGYLMVHICQAEGFYLGNLGKGRAPAAPQNPDKAATLAYMNAAFDWSISVVKQLTPADLTGVPGAGKGKGPAMTGLDLLLNAMVHTAHTRGYSDMYLRAKGITPPTYSV